VPAKKVIVVGGGFGGLNAARKLGGVKDVEVTLLDRRNHHLFQPLLYQVAMAGLDPGDIATPIRTTLAKFPNVSVLLAEVTGIDYEKREVKTDFATLPFDYLILACGSQHSYFGHDEWEPFAPGLKTLEQAVEIRRRVLTAFELAERENDPVKVRQLLTFVVVGGGPTGVELAGSLGEITRFALISDFRHIHPSHARIILIEAGNTVLATFDEKLQKRARRDLENLGVTVWTGARVTKIDADGVSLGNEEVKASTVLWGAGVKPASINAELGVPLDKQGRVFVNPDLSIDSRPNVFVIGDQAHFEQDGSALPGLAPVAMQQGRHVAKSIRADIDGKERRPFRYKDKGQMATIGRRKAVAETKGFRFTGTLAWFAWLFVHIYYLIGFKNRVVVLFQWFWSYLTYHRGSRLITQRDWIAQRGSDNLSK
jgi:NADH dehydrogenase